MNDSTVDKCKKCKHGKNNHDHWIINPDFNNGSDNELNARVCGFAGCDCKFFEKKEDITE